MIYKQYVKHVLDLLAALTAMPFVCLIILLFAPVIYLEDRGTVFYKAKRRGLNGKVFGMYKLRSMKMNAPDLRNEDNSTFNSSSDPRVTRIGGFLRKTSIDELPQIFNIIKGDMSVIGPRAPIPIEGHKWEDLSEEKRKRLSVRPGISGYSQAKFRNSISMEEKLKWDCYYVDHVSFMLDLKIIVWTIKSVVLQKNIHSNE